MSTQKQIKQRIDQIILKISGPPRGTHHFIFGSFTAVVLVAVYIGINTPSASTGNLSNTHPSRSPAEKLIKTLEQSEKNNLPFIVGTDQSPILENSDADIGLEMDTNILSHVDPTTTTQSASTPTLNVEPATDSALKTEKLIKTQQHSEKNNSPFIVVTDQSSTPENSDTDIGLEMGTDILSHVDLETMTTQSASVPTLNVEPVTDSTLKSEPDPTLIQPDSQPWISAKIKKGDTLSQLFNRLNIEISEAYKIASLEKASPILKIKSGQEIKIKKTEDSKLSELHYQLNNFESLLVTRADDDFKVERVVREPEIRINNAKASISHSLLSAAREAKVSYQIMYQMIAMFGWQIDFSMDLRKGDHFSIIYEELFLDGQKVRDGQIIAAELVVSRKKLQAVRHIDEEGFVNYFAPNGDGIKGSFLRSPLKFGHITSNFSKKRFHPISKKWKAHKGVDYGAPTGTPIMSTGNGTVVTIGQKGGYGKTVIIRHGNKYETLYAHLSKYAKNIKVGSRVSQGEIIGYVGDTGLATGPHLHYEFRIHGVHTNPMTVKLPKSDSIQKKYQSQFQQLASLWVSELQYLQYIPLARNLAPH